MADIGKPERITQDRVVQLFCDELGYRYLGDWADRAGNSNIEEGLLTEYLTASGYSPAQISIALHKLRTEAGHPDRSLYSNNQAVYQLLRYGVPVKTEAGQVTQTVHLIDWKNPAQNHFGIAEEVTLHGKQQRRPDVVLYVNGIAVGVLELKNSRVSIGDGIRQNLSNQLPESLRVFLPTPQNAPSTWLSSPHDSVPGSSCAADGGRPVPRAARAQRPSGGANARAGQARPGPRAFAPTQPLANRAARLGPGVIARA